MCFVFTILIISIICCLAQISSFKYDATSEMLELGDSCKIAETSTNGTCKLDTECSDYLNSNQTIEICGFQGLRSIICCPKIQEKIEFEYKEFNPECFLPKTNEKGFLKLIEFCPRIAEEVRNGALFPKVCDYEICRDLVCCPVGGSKRQNEGKNLILKLDQDQ